MRCFVVVLMSLLFIIGTISAYAAPVGNIATPALLKKGLVVQDQKQGYAVILASENDVTFDRNIKDQTEDTEFNFFGAKTGIAVNDKALIYALLGAGNTSAKFDILGRSVKSETETGFIWGAGGSLIVYEYAVDSNILRIGIDGRYRRIDLDMDNIIVDGTTYKPSDANVTGVVFEVDEWQAALALSYQIGTFVPYAGVKYSDASGESKATILGIESKQDIEAEDNVGVFVGADYLIGESASVNVEGRFIDETALSVGAAIRF